MLLDDGQRKAVVTKVSLAVQAGPGSGKTRTLVAKALREAAALRGTSFRVACITMSRAASAVVEERISAFASEEDQARIFVGTIHAFCLQEIFQPFHRFIEVYRDGWQVLASDQEAYHNYVDSIFGDQGENIESQLPYVRRDIEGNPEHLGTIDERRMRDWWAAIERDRYVDFPSLLYRSVQVLREQKDVAKFISARYRWILVDEFQDTTNMQLAILTEISCENSAYFLVGDRNQAIYSFAGATLETQDAFIKSLGISEKVVLTRNYRSTSCICDTANVLINTEMKSVSGVIGEPPTVRHVASKNYANLAAAVRDHFLCLTDSRKIPRNRIAVIAPNSYVSRDLASELFKIGIECARPDAALEREPLLRLLRALSEYSVGQRLSGAKATVDIVAEMLKLDQPAGWEIDEFATRVLAFRLLV